MVDPSDPHATGGAFPFALVIFDCDGVLVDSEIIAADVLSRMLTEQGRVTDPAQVFERYLGQAFRVVQEDFAAATGRPLPPEFTTAYRAALEAEFRARLQPIEGIKDVLGWLQARGCPIALASSSSLPRIAHSLAVTGLSAFFEGRVFSSSMVSRGKPAPDLFLHVAREIQAEPGATLVIEDSPAGVTAGKAAGMTVWGFTGGGHHAKFDGVGGLKQAGADRILATMADFAEGVT
jgi:HAD superfamily hydrolase (TIGR01509 family)